MTATVKPILFSGPMIRALLDGRKTQTRRLLRLPTKTFSGGPIYERKDMGGWEPTVSGGGGCFTIGKDGRRAPAPEQVAIWHRTTGVCMDAPYQPGDLLWVREAWRTPQHFDDRSPSALPNGEIVPRLYIADGERKFWRYADPDGRFRQGMHMPRHFSRLTLRVTEVRVQRLQSISEADAIAEGVFFQEPTAEDLEWHEGWAAEHGYDPKDQPMRGVWIAPGTRQGFGMTAEQRNREQWGPTAEFAFRCLWDSINEARAPWSSNPWVAAISFETIKANVDQVLREAA